MPKGQIYPSANPFAIPLLFFLLSVCYPDPVCPERLDSDPDPVNIRPRLWAAFGRSENDQPIRVTVYPLALKISCSDM